MQCVIRAGAEPHLGVLEALVDLAEHGVVGHHGSRRTPPRCGRRRGPRRASRCARTTRMPGLSASTRNIVAPPRSPGSPDVRAMQIANAAPSRAGDEPLAAVDPPAAAILRRARCDSAAGSEPAPGAGSVIAKHDRISPAASGRRYALLLLGRRDRLQQVHVALVGRGEVERQRSEQRVAGLLEDDAPGRACPARGRRTPRRRAGRTPRRPGRNAAAHAVPPRRAAPRRAAPRRAARSRARSPRFASRDPRRGDRERDRRAPHHSFGVTTVSHLEPGPPSCASGRRARRERGRVAVVGRRARPSERGVRWVGCTQRRVRSVPAGVLGHPAEPGARNAEGPPARRSL